MVILDQKTRRLKEKFERKQKAILKHKPPEDNGDNHYLIRFIKQIEKEKHIK